MYLAAAEDSWKNFWYGKNWQEIYHYAQLYEEADFAFVNHSASKSQGWVVQNWI